MNVRRNVSTPIEMIRALLILLGVPYLLVGAFALVAPRAWFDTFDVGALGGFNDHLVRDVGEAFIAVSVLALLAAYWMDRRVILAAAITWLVFGVPHFVNHVIERDELSLGSYLGSIASVGAGVVISAVVVVLVMRNRPTRT